MLTLAVEFVLREALMLTLALRTDVQLSSETFMLMLALHTDVQLSSFCVWCVSSR